MPFGTAVGEGFTNGVISKITIAELGPGDGIFIYTPTVGAGNLVGSFSSFSGTDKYGNPFQAGSVLYGPGGSYAQLSNGVLNFQGSASQFAPAYVETQNIAGLLEISSGRKTSGDVAALIDLQSRSANIGVSQIDLGADQVICNSGILSGIFGLGTPPNYPLPTDGNSGSSWATGERAYINNCVNAINFLVSVLQGAGIL